MKYATLLVLFSLLPALSLAQTPTTAPTPISDKKYAGEPIVFEQLKTTYRYAPDGTGDKTIHVLARIQSEAAARQYGVLYVPYAAGNEEVELAYIRVHKADGSTVETPAADAQDMPAEVTRLAPFYSDLRQKQYPVRSLSVGDTLEYEGIIHMTRAQAVSPGGKDGGTGEFWGAENLTTTAVSLDETIELHLPRSRSVTVVSPRHKPELADTATERIYRWHSTQLKPTVPPPGAPSDPKPDTVPSDGLPDIAWTSFPDWAAVGAWYRSLAADRAAATPELRAKAATLTQGATTDEEKVRRIYTYVSGNIRYIGVAFGLGRYQPHPASEVLGNQYGDCKDKHTLLSALLSAAGFETSTVLIGDGVKFDADVAAPSSFNHVITAVILKDAVVQKDAAAPYDPYNANVASHPIKRVFLDSTAEVAPYGMLSASLRDKEALLIPAGTLPPVIVKTPATLPFTAFDHWEARATLDKDGKLTGHFDVTLRGDIELILRWSLHQTTAAQWQQLGQNLSSNFGYSGTVSNFAPGSAEQTDVPLHYAYDYERDTYGDWPNHRILSLVPYGLFTSAQLDKQPTDPIPTGNPRLESARSVIHLPSGYAATLPDPVHVKSSFANYDVTYASKDGDLICETKLDVHATTVPAEAWQEYNSFAREVADHSQIFVQLHGPGDPQSTATVAASTTGSPAAETAAVTDVGAQALLQQAMQALQAGHADDAEAKIQAARKLNPDQRGLWWASAGVAMARRNQDEAEADYKKELAQYPDDLSSLYSLAQLQLGRKQRPQAIETFQKLLKLRAGDPQLILTVSSLLTAEKRYPESLNLLQSAALKHPDNKQFVLQLGRTQLAAGRNEEAVSTLQTALEDTTDPLILNDAAYELASHHADLLLAESSARKALAGIDAESQKFTLSDVGATELGRASLLSATWDTMGWIEFVQGHLGESESLLIAAWTTSQHAEVGYHLGQLYEKEGKPQQAFEAYRRAQAALRKDETFTGSDELAPRILALEKTGLQATPAIDSSALGQERIYTLPLFTSKQVSGDYYLLLSPGKLEAASFIPESSPDTAELKALEAKLSLALQSALFADNKSDKADKKLPLFPANSTAKLIRRGVLSCSPMLHSCMLALILPQDVRMPSKPMAPAPGALTAATN